MSYQRYGMCLAAAISLVGAATADVVTDWDNAWIAAVRATGGPPCPIARTGAILHVAMFDAINSVDHTYESYHMHMTVPPGTSKEAAGAMAAHRVLTTLFPQRSLVTLFDSQLAAHLSLIPDGPAKTGGMVLGVACAEGIMALRANDGADAPQVYTPGSNPGDWVPTPPDFSAPASPQWPNVTPWTMLSGDQFRPKGPGGHAVMTELLASSEYLMVFNDVKAFGAIDSTVRTPYETQTARFWANDRNGTFKPPGHLSYITQVIAANRGNTVIENARLFALLHLAMGDAGVVAWDAKYSTPIDLWRPVTGIRQAATDGNPATVADPAWTPLSHDPAVNGFTPPFPAYISGHATFSAAHAGIIAGFYGTDDIAFTITSDDTPGVFRTYRTLSSAARENGRSRIFLGVHWQFDADDGYASGSALADYVIHNFLRRIGDLNGDGVINTIDLGILLSNWSIPATAPACGGAEHCGPDINGDGVVNTIDLGTLLANWTL